MAAIVYIARNAPTPEEGAAIAALRGRGVATQLRNARHWRGETERYPIVYADSREIREAYGRAGVEARELVARAGDPPERGSDPTGVTPEPDNAPQVGAGAELPTGKPAPKRNRSRKR